MCGLALSKTSASRLIPRRLLNPGWLTMAAACRGPSDPRTIWARPQIKPLVDFMRAVCLWLQPPPTTTTTTNPPTCDHLVGEDIKPPPPPPLLLLLLQLAIEEAACTLCKILRGFMVRSSPWTRPVSAAVVQPDKHASIRAKGDELHLLCLNFWDFNSEEEEIQNENSSGQPTLDSAPTWLENKDVSSRHWIKTMPFWHLLFAPVLSAVIWWCFEVQLRNCGHFFMQQSEVAGVFQCSCDACSKSLQHLLLCASH